MSDFPPFEDDPAADFLAREQDQLAELGGDDFITSEDVPEAEAAPPPAAAMPLTDTVTVAAPPEIPQQNGEVMGDMFGTEPPEQNNADFFVDEVAENGFSALDGTAADFGQSAFPADGASEPQDMYSEIKRVDELRAEPEKLRRWREDQKTLLEQKDCESERKAEEWRAVAKKELEDWYKHRADQLGKNEKNNREAEAAFVQERDDSVPGHEWERICRVCEFNPKGSARPAKDVGRMRSILLQLKQTPLVR